MAIEKEIMRAIKRMSYTDKDLSDINEQERIIKEVNNAIVKQLVFNSDNATTLILKHKGKKRLVKQYSKEYLNEKIVCQCIKQILDREFKVKYPNRNAIIHDFFNILSAIKQMEYFTILKFDFKDYFNSVSSIYVFEKYLKKHISNRQERDLIKKFVNATKYAYAGLCTSNTIAEIIASDFDKAIRQNFAQYGLIYYERYIDDSIIILNEYMEQNEIGKILEEILEDIFHDETIVCSEKCKTKFNKGKMTYISSKGIKNTSNVIYSVDFLGYEFWLQHSTKNNIKITYGITKEKQDKYQNRINKIVSAYIDKDSADKGNMELLRHRIAAFASREVYLTKHFNSNVWRVKGFISNYGELKYFLGTEHIEKSTEDFLKNAITNAFRQANVSLPYFLKNNKNGPSGYSLYYNMKSSKTILLVDHIGYDYKSLVNLCEQIGINHVDVNGKRRGYGTLVKEYLIKVKVGY